MNRGFVMGEERATGLPCRQGESLLQSYIKLFFGGVVLFFVSFFFFFSFFSHLNKRTFHNWFIH